jgi:PAS domain S-box-containing protein
VALADGLPVGVCVVSDAWRVLFWNQVLEAWTGRRREDVVGTELFAQFPDLAGRRYRGRLQAVLRGGPPAVFSPQLHASLFACRLADGESRPHRTTATLFRGGEARSLVMTVEDATESIQQTDLVSRLRKRALAESEERRRTQLERERLIVELQEALASVRVLKGLIPICADCKQIRGDEGYWQSVESYIAQRTDADFSHGICPDCMKKLYGDEPP